MTPKNEYTYQLLQSPPRLVIDFSMGFSKPAYQGSDPTGLITNTRYGTLDNMGRRIVFDLKKNVRVDNHFYIAPSNTQQNYRLVFDLSTAMGQDIPASPPAPSMNLSTLDSVQEFQTLPYSGYPMPTAKPSFLIRRPQYTIVIDAGHGGGDPGSIGGGNIREKDIVLNIAKKLKEQLERTGRYNVHLTRSSDYYIQLRERFKKARDHKADLFISLHADKIHVPTVRGVSVYTLSETASDKETARLAKQENNAGVVAGVDLGVEEEDVANILLDLVRRETLNESKLFAELFVSGLKNNNIRYLKNPHRYAGFAVLKAPDVPSVLIETGFLSNTQDTQLLQTAAYQNRLTETIQSSIDGFFDRLERLNSE